MRESHSGPGLRVLHRPPAGEEPPGGPLLLLVHGAMDRATSFTRLMSKLPDWEILAYDRRGYGHSHHLGPPEDFDSQVEDLLSVLGDRQAVAFGHSLGGDIVLAAMSRHPGLLTAALVWEPPQPWLPFWPADKAGDANRPEMSPEDRAERFMRRMIGDRIWERLPNATKARRRAEGLTMDGDLATIANHPVFDPSLILAPVLVGRGGLSLPYQRRATRELVTHLPKGELVEIAESGHGAHLSHPTDVAAFVRRAAGLGGPPA